MYKLVINGGAPLNGSIRTSGSKNATLPIFFASILADGPLKLSNTPQLSDVSTTLRLLMDMGSNFVLEEDGSIFIDSSALTNLTAEYSLVKTMRASILTLGPMLAKYKKAKISLPGGCAIGTRPVNLHLDALEKMGATIEVKNGYIYATTKGLVGAQINFDLISVTATENIVMAATLAKGITTLNNAAQEPEVTDLIRCLKKMGAKISGENTSTLVIEGVDHLSSVEYSICPDRIEAGTYLVAAAITGGKITVNNIEPDAMRAVIGKLIETGADIQTNRNSIKLDMKGKRPHPVNIRTSAYPNFPTDMQAQFMALNSVAEGSSTITETIFENRFMHVPELKRMGAQIKIKNKTAFIIGPSKLTGAEVMATDLRASVSLILAALTTKGKSVINRIYHLDRGYEDLEKKLRKVGAKIKRIN